MAEERTELILAGDVEPLGEDLDNAEQDIEEFWKRLSGVMNSMAEAIGRSVSSSVTDGFDAVNSTLQEKLDEVEKGFKETQDAIAKSANTWTDIIVKIWAGLEVIKFIFVPIVAAIKVAFSVLSGIISGIVKGIIAILKTMVDVVLTSLKGIASGIIGAFKTAFDLVSMTLSKIKDLVTSVLSALLDQMPLLVVSLTAGLKEGFKFLKETETISVRLRALLKSTGEMAGFTERELNGMAGALQNITTYSRDAAKSAQIMLARFFNVRGDVFNDALTAAADLAVVMNTDLASAADFLGRALNNPIEGVRQLYQAGLELNYQELALVETLVMSGRVVDAQNYLLRRLADSIGGSAAEAAKTFSGQIQQVNNLLQEMWREIADALTPALEKLLPIFKDGAKWTTQFARNLKELMPEIIAWVEGSLPVVSAWFQSVLDIASATFKQIADFAVRAYTLFLTAWENAPEALKTFESAAGITAQKIKIFFMQIWDGDFFPALEYAWDKMANYVTQAMLKALKPVAEFMDDTLGILGGNVFETLRSALQEEAEIDGRWIDRNRRQAEQVKVEESERLKAARKRLEELQAQGQGEQKPFWDRFDENLRENQEAVKDFGDWAADQLDQLIRTPNMPEDQAPARGNRGSGRPFAIPTERTAGNFEGLQELNRRIQSAAAKSPELILLEEQTRMMRDHYSSQRTLGQRQAEAGEAAAAAGQQIVGALSSPRPAVYT